MSKPVTTDLPSALRRQAAMVKAGQYSLQYQWLLEAADEIERLTKENMGMANRLSSVVPYAP
jgi:hypothetical protein